MKRRWMLLALLAGGLALGTACDGPENQQEEVCDVKKCICRNSEDGGVCDPEFYEGEGKCLCHKPSGACPYFKAAEVRGYPLVDVGSEPPSPGPTYRFVLLEDNTDPVAGEFPGNDVDAISVLKASGGEVFATRVVDFNIGDPNGNNSATDPNQMVGAPDANCVANSGKFTALGGSAAGGYAIVEFGTTGVDITIENCDFIKIYELGATLCGMFDDDAGTIGVSTSSDLGTFIEIGSTGAGNYTIPVSGLP